jgi:precorrin-4 methylase
MKFYADGSSFKYFTPPDCTATDMNWFKQKGVVYSSVDSAVAALTKQLENAAANGLRTAEIMCTDKSVYDGVRAEMLTLQKNSKA